MKETEFKILFAAILVTLQIINLIALIYAQKKGLIGLTISSLIMLCVNFIVIYALKQAHIKITDYDNQTPGDLLAYVGLVAIVLLGVLILSIAYCYFSDKVKGLMTLILPVLSGVIMVVAISIFDRINDAKRN